MRFVSWLLGSSYTDVQIYSVQISPSVFIDKFVFWNLF